MNSVYIKIAFVVFVNVCSFSWLIAQEKTDDQILEELGVILKDTSISDTTYLRVKTDLGQIGGYFRVGYWDSLQIECLEALSNKLTEVEKNKVILYRSGALNNLGYVYKYQGDYTKALSSYELSVEAIKTVSKIDTSLYSFAQRDYAQTINNIAVIYVNQGDVDKGISYYEEAMSIRLKLNDLEGAALTLNNLGYVASNQGDIEKSLTYYFESLKIREEIKDYAGLAQVCGNIATQYADLKDPSESLNYHYKSLANWKLVNREDGVADVYNNLGTHYLLQEKLDSAQYYYERSLFIRDSMQLKEDVASSYYNLGHLSIRKKDYQLSLTYFMKSLDLYEGLSFKMKICQNLEILAEVYFELSDFEKAKSYSEEAMLLAQELNYPEELYKNYKIQYRLKKREGNFEDALYMHELYVLMKDSLNNASIQKGASKLQARYEYEKQKTIDDVENEKQKAIGKAENDKLVAFEKQEKEKQQILTIAAVGGLALVVVFLFFVFNRLRITKKQKLLIESQKEAVEIAHNELGEKNQEIMDSINYAKRIQSAILPPNKVVKEYLKESFILYKPKDIVAGDFYWLEHVDGKVLFAAADCTGHGVPGAMVSVVCNNGLNRSVREHGLSDPGEILDKTREIVIQEFEKSEEEVKDGMDIALCSLEGSTLKFAGAHNPLWIVRNGEVLETKADKQPIGKFDKQTAYTTHTFELQKGDTFYVFSDGYVDQFGGAKGKKFKSKAFKELLLSIQDQSMELQRDVINDAFENWRGSLEQIDDVCVIGVRV